MTNSAFDQFQIIFTLIFIYNKLATFRICLHAFCLCWCFILLLVTGTRLFTWASAFPLLSPHPLDTSPFFIHWEVSAAPLQVSCQVERREEVVSEAEGQGTSLCTCLTSSLFWQDYSALEAVRLSWMRQHVTILLCLLQGHDHSLSGPCNAKLPSRTYSPSPCWLLFSLCCFTPPMPSSHPPSQ